MVVRVFCNGFSLTTIGLVFILSLSGCWKRLDDRRDRNLGTDSSAPVPHEALPAPSFDQPQPIDPRTDRDLTPQQIAELVMPAVVRVLVESRSDSVKQGSGFFIAPDLVVTNYHVIEESPSWSIKLAVDRKLKPIEKILTKDASRDLAVLLVDPGNSKTYLRLGIRREVSVGDPVYAVGNPRGLEGTFSLGIVSALRSIQGVNLLQITAPISSGSSGGPVLDAHAEVVGIATWTVIDGQNLNFAVSVRELVSLLEAAGLSDSNSYSL